MSNQHSKDTEYTLKITNILKHLDRGNYIGAGGAQGAYEDIDVIIQAHVDAKVKEATKKLAQDIDKLLNPTNTKEES